MVLLALSLVIAGSGTTLLLRPTLVGQLDASLRSIAADPTLVLGGDASTGEFGFENIRTAPQPYYVAVVDDSDQVMVDNWEWQPRSVAPDLSTMELKFDSNSGAGFAIYELKDGLGAPWRAVVVPEDQYNSNQVFGTLIVAMPMSSVNATMASFLAIFFGFGLSVLIFAAVLTRMLVSATLRPLRKVESTAMNFAAGDYDQRLPEATPNTEVGRLSRSLNSMLGQIDSALIERDRTISQMRRFVGDASHELRTPLVTVRGYAELYRMGALDEPTKVGQAMDRIEGEAKRMGGLVEDLLQLARLDENREMAKDVLDLEPLVEDAAMDTRAQAPDRTIRVHPTVLVADEDHPYRPEETAFTDLPVETEAPAEPEPDTDAPEPAKDTTRGRLARVLGLRRRSTPAVSAEPADAADAPAGVPLEAADEFESDDDVPAMIYGNSDKIRQAIQNIVGNALRYTPEGTPLELGVVIDVTRERAIIEVIDHGEGIPEQSRAQIFQRFWRADTSRTRDTGGTGLGLAIVSAIVQTHEGTVDVVETPGGGATFRLSFPLLMAPPVDEEPSTES
ncbi:sensor histidine kinase [Gulosibacter sp. ACHW.36C]|uniref:histidine kinase n=1 Tax=Gulosibacter sediminis TaxID=1729695 RepID=A0ABY4MZX3_9MICO|nr:HAMP domain-containing sensor histidine kinase [Gulosibacter sediminis]UQN15559.1 HAMP domain-containing histidine kinase [Gulosibacter sediminis]